mmetsp:Transcript_6886/g.13267  ORF Transcript_6886/g.13267 Transcript_6886/m.13267 type:complete len:229 (-) Transcript_6886:173-859(-)
MPDAEGRGGSPHVRLAGTARPHPRVEAEPERGAGALCAELLELQHRAAVDLQALLDILLKALRQLLRRKRALLRRHPRRHGALDLVNGGAVKVQPHRVEQLQHRRVGAALHREAHRKAIGIGEGESSSGLLLEGLEVVGVQRRPCQGDGLLGRLRREEAERLDRRHGLCLCERERVRGDGEVGSEELAQKSSRGITAPAVRREVPNRRVSTVYSVVLQWLSDANASGI